jgi:hypothetical protein
MEKRYEKKVTATCHNVIDVPHYDEPVSDKAAYNLDDISCFKYTSALVETANDVCFSLALSLSNV